MNKLCFPKSLNKILLFAALAGVLITACDRDEITHEEIVKTDLLIIIDSLGSPCEEVVKYESTTELGYVVSCRSGHEYVISVSPQGRVEVQHDQ